MAANLVTLLDYLQAAPPSLSITDNKKRKSTVSKKYGHKDISTVRRWSEFQWSHIHNTCGVLLNSTLIAHEPMPQSPAKVVSDETSFRSRFDVYLQKRLERSLAAGFAHLQSSSALPRTMTILSFGNAGAARALPGGFKPDAAIYELGVAHRTSPNRVPGEMKLSSAWKSTWQFNTKTRAAYYQVLAQLNYYMEQYRTRYGFICTDQELVAVRRTRLSGTLKVSDSIACRDARGTRDNPRMTVLLAIWYLGMLAADDNGWSL